MGSSCRRVSAAILAPSHDGAMLSYAPAHDACPLVPLDPSARLPVLAPALAVLLPCHPSS